MGQPCIPPVESKAASTESARVSDPASAAGVLPYASRLGLSNPWVSE